jgi:5-methylcytosine-specific restriction endonuclease McrA
MKWMLLYGLVEAAPLLQERGRFELGVVASALIPLLVQQARSSSLEGFGELRQIHRAKLDVLTVFEGEGQFARRPYDRDAKLFVAWSLAQWPALRLQLVGSECVRLLWPLTPEQTAFFERPKANAAVPKKYFELGADGAPVLPAIPGAIACLNRLRPLLRTHVESRWLEHVVALNPDLAKGKDPEQTVRARLFPSAEREALANETREALARVYGPNCFWCDRPIADVTKAVVDHVIPWSYSRNNAIENLVLTAPDCRCNGRKSSQALSPRLALLWLDGLERNYGLLARESRTDLVGTLAWASAMQRDLAASGSSRVAVFDAGEGCSQLVEIETQQAQLGPDVLERLRRFHARVASGRSGV